MSRSSKGEEISVSFKLVEPPGISVLTIAPSQSSGNVIAAHRDVVLLAIPSFHGFVDLFVYQASRRIDPSRRRQPSLLLLPDPIKCTKEIGIMSCTSSNDVDHDSPSFVVAELRVNPEWPEGPNHVRVFRPESGQWEVFDNLHIRGANEGHAPRWWSTDLVVPHDDGRRRYMIWVDYYRGMIVMDLYWKLKPLSSKNLRRPPRLWYVPLPVDRVGDPKDNHHRHRGWPRACRSVSSTRYGIKFVSVDTQHLSNFGIGNRTDRNVFKWSHRFRVTTWSLCQDDNSWKKDLTMHEEEFWEVFHGGDRFPFPHGVLPEFPVVDVDNPDVVVFRLQKLHLYNYDRNRDEPKWMIKVDLRKKVLLAATSYSRESDGLSSDAEAINSARFYHDPIPSELPRYMDGGQA